MEVSINGGSPKRVFLPIYNGKSQSAKIDDLGISPISGNIHRFPMIFHHPGSVQGLHHVATASSAASGSAGATSGAVTAPRKAPKVKRRTRGALEGDGEGAGRDGWTDFFLALKVLGNHMK